MTVILRHITNPFCVGSSSAWIVCQYNRDSARCACGATLKRLADGEDNWVHGDYRRECPAYECQCGQRHNCERTQEDQEAWNLAMDRYNACREYADKVDAEIDSAY